MEIVIPASDSERIVSLLCLLGQEFPDVTEALIRTAGEATKGIVINISPMVPKQTNAQRSYYHMWKNRFADWCGNTPDEMHDEILCQAFGSEVHDTRLGRKVRPAKRSSKADRIEYSALIETLIRTAAQLGFEVPPPIQVTCQEEDDD